MSLFFLPQGLGGIVEKDIVFSWDELDGKFMNDSLSLYHACAHTHTYTQKCVCLCELH